MDTSTTDIEVINAEETPVNGAEDSSAETKPGKRKRSTKKPVETEETNISNGRPRRTLPKREEVPAAIVNGAREKKNKTRAQRNSAEQAAVDADDEQERDKNIPILHDVADVVWVKMGGHPWWPSLIIRDPNDTTRCFTKVSGNTRAKRMYFVVFYGSTADFAWVPDAAVIPYQGVEAFTKYAQEIVDKAQTKSQKEQLTERFQLKVTIGRREDWELAVREADDSLKQTSETRLEEIDPKVQFYTTKLVAPKGQPGRKSKASANKAEESSEPSNAASPSADPTDRSLLAEKTFEFKSDDESSEEEMPVRKTPSVKIKLKKQTSNDADSTTTTPPAKRRHMRKSTEPTESTTASGKTNGSSFSHELRSPKNTNEAPVVNGNSTGRKRGRPRLSKPSVIINNVDDQKMDVHSDTPEVTTQRKSITKPQAFMKKTHPVASMNNILVGQHHRFDTLIGFLSPFEEQEVYETIEQIRPTKTFEEAEQIARRRFEHILCVNLNKTTVTVPQEWFYSFLFAHPILIVKNPQWFNDKKNSDSLTDNDLLNNVNRTQSSSSLQVLKHQLGVLSKLYRNELQIVCTMNNQTESNIRPEPYISTGYFISITSVGCILILILIILFLFFTKKQNDFVSDDYELSTDRSTSINGRKSSQYRRSKQYSSIDSS
ncbi:unnamed protein product [Adineta steineri]|uniref:PWWP domain-containing protein n=1 Tax=Adineta steineri TaxID=433720 RepID=A0A814B7G6_9BILA|nr:unnamed protein product [Adineta steineri]CAF3629905.1 unnamed protein product [Adineta steineri]